MKHLYRSKTNRVISGIFGGLGEYTNTDPVLYRALFILVFLCTGFFPGILAYIICIFVIPEMPVEMHTNNSTQKTETENTTGTKEDIIHDVEVVEEIKK